ncbi:MAG: ABC transporter ATP-binding protein [Ignavibacteriae bacterium]|nr:ABC transporter ATP-binding protein [Ignavibacteriota bacterium]
MNMPLAVQCVGINKRYPHFQLKNIDITLEQGTVMGLVGPNGAGKSTILRIVMGLVVADSGQVKVLDNAVPKDQVAAKSKVGFVSEDMHLYETESIAFHMNFIKSVFPSWDEDYAKSLLQRFDLIKEQKVKGLSHGQRVKATLLLALARRPKLLVFDEPTTGLDPAVRKDVVEEMMNALQDETNSILFSSHNTLDIEKISDYITFLYDGSVVESKDKETYFDSWRRLRLINTSNKELPELPNIKEHNHSGQLSSIIVNDFEDTLPKKIISAGIEVQAIERLTLEEIFLCNVQYAKGLKV